MDDEDEFQVVHLLQLMLAEQQGDEFEDELLACVGLVCYGLEEARHNSVLRRSTQRLYLTRSVLLPDPRINTPWQALYHSQSDRGFITTMGFDVVTFHNILRHGFERLWNETPIPCRDVLPSSTPRVNGRSLDAYSALGLILHYLNSTMLEATLAQVFALVPSTVSRYLTFTLRLLLLTLRHMKEAQIHWPVDDEFQEYNDLVLARHPLLVGAFGTMDGLNLPVQTSRDQEIENSTFNGWLQEHFISSVFAFGAEGMPVNLRDYEMVLMPSYRSHYCLQFECTR
jgi:hypothetical protein